MNPTVEDLAVRVEKLEALLGLRPSVEPVLAALLTQVCQANRVALHRVKSKSREGGLIAARQQYCWLARVGQYPDHVIATVIRPDFHRSVVHHHAAACEDRMDTEPAFLAGMRVLAAAANIRMPERYRASET
jgi:hypothetical protein